MTQEPQVMKTALAFYLVQFLFNIRNFFHFSNTNITSIFILTSVIITMLTVPNWNKEKDTLIEEKGEQDSGNNWAKTKGKGA